MEKMFHSLFELLKGISKRWLFSFVVVLWIFCGFVVLRGSIFIQPYVLSSVYDGLYTFSVIFGWFGIAFLALFLFRFLRAVVAVVYLKSGYRIISVIGKMSDDELLILRELYFNKHCAIPLHSACFERFKSWRFISHSEYVDLYATDCYLQDYIYKYLQKHQSIFDGKD